MFVTGLDKRTTGKDIFQKVDDFFTEMGLQRKDCVVVCTDGAAAMTGHTVGFHDKVRSATDSPTTFTHCVINREALVSTKISPDLHPVVQDAVKVINFIKSRTLNTRLCAKLCDNMESDYNTFYFILK